MAPQSTARPATPLARRREWWLRPRWLLLLLSVTVILAQAAFWGMTALLRTPPPYPALDLVVTGEGRYQDSIWPLPFTLVYTDHVPITLTIEPAAPVSLSLRPWGEDGLLTPTSTLAVSDSPHIGVTGPLMEGHNLLVVEGPPGHQAAASVWYLPRSAPYDLSHITRTLAITITPERIQAVYEADFGPGAPRDDLTDLWADDIPPGLFLKRVFYPTRDDFTAAALTTIGTPLRTVQGDTYRVRIHASSDEPFYNPERLPILLNVC
ncbi:MAG TPA: hypothetical protein ENI37_07625, partial [Chloroflexi bacterium]|nr:hypothetical protein [Chloroflexota bacterium]